MNIIICGKIKFDNYIVESLKIISQNENIKKIIIVRGNDINVVYKLINDKRKIQFLHFEDFEEVSDCEILKFALKYLNEPTDIMICSDKYIAANISDFENNLVLHENNTVYTTGILEENNKLIELKFIYEKKWSGIFCIKKEYLEYLFEELKKDVKKIFLHEVINVLAKKIKILVRKENVTKTP